MGRAHDDMTAVFAGNRPVYRLKKRRLRRETVAEVWDDLGGGVAATCTFKGKAVFASMEIDCGPNSGVWRFQPNRRLMPTGWRLEPTGSGRTTVFSQRVGAKLVNPLYRTLLAFQREGESVGHSVRDARKESLGRLLQLERSDWVLARVGEPVARIGFARPPVSAAGSTDVAQGPLGRLRAAAREFGSHDRALMSVGDAHAVSAAEALVLLLLMENLTEVV